MLIDLKASIDSFNMTIRGVVHVGAHYGQEYEEYRKNGINDIIFIEPCDAAFKTLQAKMIHDPNVILFQCACGEKEGHEDMYVSPGNQGQSNSLLRPKIHQQYYPDIPFREDWREKVAVRRLDDLPFTRQRYNLLMMDTQGAEMMVLKGAADTLPHLDYIYTEVNSQELYEGNAMVTELDDFLRRCGFERKATHWVGTQGWGDAIYIRV